VSASARPTGGSLAVLDAVPEAIIVLDAEACIVHVNRAALELFGYAGEALVGEGIGRLLSGRSGRLGSAAVLRRRIGTAASGRPFRRGPSLELQGVDAGGSEFPIEVKVAPAVLDGRSLVVATIRRTADRAEAEAVERLAEAVQSSTDAILTTDLDGVITSWNRGAERMYGYTPDEAIGREVTLLVDGDRAHEGDEILTHIRGGRIVKPFETIRVTKDGRHLDVSLTVSPLRDGGVIVGALTVGRDISAHKRVDRTLRALLESAPDAVVVVGSAGRIALVNRQTEELFGHPREKLLGQDFGMLIPARLRTVGPDSVTAFTEPDSRQTGAALELVGLRADGSEIPIEMTFSPLETPDGVLVYAAIRDITERKLIDEELRRSNRDLEQFAYVASHDLSEPLRVIAGFTDLLARRYAGHIDAEADRFINFIVTGVERMQALIDDLLAYSRAGRGDIELQHVDTGALVQEVLWSLEPQLTAKHVSVEVDKLPFVRAEPALLRQIFQNLVSNAVKFADADEPRVAVRAAHVGDAWRFDVEDNGPGVDPRHAERVFEMFQRLHGREVAGSGMGLAIVKRLTERHGGRVWVMPAHPRGSVFSFTIPDRPQRA
jgi:PAS domain S-box-containing protein